MNTVVRLCLLFSIICLSTAAQAADMWFDDCTVKTLSAPVTADSFSCKVSDKSALAHLPLKVRLRGVKASDETAVAKNARQFLDAKLNSAKSITLKNVQLTGYCIVTADVFADSENIADLMLAQSLVSQYYPPKPVKVVVKTKASTSAQTQAVPAQATRYTPAIAYQNQIVFTPDMTFEEAFDMIANAASPPLPMLIMWGDLEKNCFVDADTPIEVAFSGPIKLRTALEMLLRSIDAQYAVDGGVVTIASSQMNLPRRMVTRVYDIRELVSSRYPSYGNGYGNQSGYGTQSGFGSQTGSGFGNGSSGFGSNSLGTGMNNSSFGF